MSSSELMLSNFTRRPQGEPFSEIVFGERIDDPYRWMERADRASEVTDFIRQASEHTISQLAALPGRALLRERVAAGLRAGVRYGDLREAGGRLFYRRMDPDAQLAKLVTRDGEGLERVLYDPEAGGTPGAAINSYSVSPSGATVALHTAAGGSEVGAIRFIDVAGGDHLSDFLEPVWGQLEASWLDEHTVAYTRITATGAADPTLSMRACLRRLGGKDGPDLLGAETEGAPRFEPREWPIILLEDDGDWAIGLGVGARADARVFVARRTDLVAGRPAWREIAGYDDRVNAAALHGDVLYLATTREASNGEVVAIDLAITGTLAQARTVIHASEAIITELVAGADGIYVLAQTDGISRLFFLGMNEAPAELPLPIQGFAALLRRSRPGPGVTFALQDWFTAPRWFRASGTAISPLGVDSASYAGLQDARQIRETATSADGTQVPLAILLPPDHRPVPAPLLLVGYGSYGISTASAT